MTASTTPGSAANGQGSGLRDSSTAVPDAAPRHPANDLDGAARQWRKEGWVIIDGLIPQHLIDAAIEELRNSDRGEAAGPIRRPGTGRGSGRRSDDEPKAAFRGRQFDGTTLFPVIGCPTLNRLFVHDELVRFAGLALQTDDLRIYQTRVWSKYGEHTNYEQPMHRDGNHSLVPIENVPDWWHLECFVYLQDVDHTNGATGIVPGSVARASLTDRTSRSREEAPDLYDAELIATAPAGSVVAYRSDVWHRGHDLLPGTERHIMVVAFRPATAEWIGFDEHGPLVNSPDWVSFAEAATPDDLALFGVPRPGHRYWTSALLEAMALMYPGLDLGPWFDQL
ncbi:MAG: phytanoyl-CoA dioxygenase family protein [Actinomycetota bacterium]